MMRPERSTTMRLACLMVDMKIQLPITARSVAQRTGRYASLMNRARPRVSGCRRKGPCRRWHAVGIRRTNSSSYCSCPSTSEQIGHIIRVPTR